MLALSRSYSFALKMHLDRSQGSDLSAARKLGRRALRVGIDTLELARLHDTAFASLEIPGSSARSKSSRARRGTAFFHAAVAPLEESHLAESASNGRRKSIIDILTRRTDDLAASNAELREEIAHRKAVEQSLRTSETTTSLLLKKSRRMQEELRFLSRRLLTVQEDERRRISRELHDVIAQTLAGINVRLAVLRSQTSANAKDFHDKIRVTERLVEQSVEIVHRFASSLRPPVLDDLGLIPALRSCLKAFTARTGVPAHLTAFADVESLDTPARTALFRIAQEALTNITRHSRASRVRMDLRTAKGSVRMKIIDDGRGFSAKGSSRANDGKRLGLLGMRERAEMVGGSFRVESAEGKGTTLVVEIPCGGTPSKDIPEERGQPLTRSQ